MHREVRNKLAQHLVPETPTTIVPYPCKTIAQTDRYGKTTFRDSMGRKQGTMDTDRYGKTTYRDEQGRRTGSSTTDRYGKTTYRDAQGRIQGTRK